MARRLGIGMLTAGLLASMAPAGQAVTASTPTVRGRPAVSARPLASTGLNAAAVARMRASSAPRTLVHTGAISGVVHSVAGSAAGRACVTALGLAARAIARTGPDGRYLLGSLQPGQYRLSVGACPGLAHPLGQPAISAFWSSGPATVTVRAGQISNPAPISTLHLDLASLRAAAHQVLPASAVRAKRGSISGRVTGNGHPLRGVCAVAISQKTESETLALTGKAGRYRISKLRPGRYVVGFVTGLGPCPNKGNWLIQLYPGVNSPFETRKVKPVRVRAGKDTGGIDAHLKKGGEITGTVRSKSGKVLRGICVSIQLRSGIDEGIGLLSVTNKFGKYAVRSLFPGRYQVQFSIGCGTKGNYASQWWRDSPSQAHAKTIRIAGGQIVTRVNARLLPGASVSGVVKAVNAAGKPLGGVCVFPISGMEDNPDFGVVTRRDGSYRLIGLSAGRLTLQFDPTCETDSSIYLIVNRSVKLTTGQAVTGFNEYLPVGGGISGVVTDAHGHPVGGVCVQVNDDNGDLTQTRPNGHYSLRGVENGSFQVVFFGGCGNTGSVAPQFYPNSPTSLFAKVVRFKPNTVTPNVDATMQPGGTLAGLVTDTAGRRLSHICVTAETSQLPLETDLDPGNAFTRDGKYQISNLAPGAYTLTFSCGGYGMEFFRSQVNEAAAGLLSVNAGATTKVPVTRLSRAGAISGRVTTKAGKTPFTCVQVTPAADRNAYFPVGFGVAYENGHYRVDGLAPARYLVQFVSCLISNKLGGQWYRRKATEAAATAVRVFAGRTAKGINGVLTVGGTIAGRVVGPTGKPAKAICVSAFSQQAQDGSFGQTGRSGRYRLTGLSTGRWTLNFRSCSRQEFKLASVTRPGTVRVTAPQTVTGVNIRLPLGGSVSGHVVDQAGRRPLGGVCVVLVPAKASGSFGFALTDGRGRYVASQLEAGNYRAYIGDPSCDDLPDFVAPFAPQWYNTRPTQATAKVVHVSAGVATTGINGALTPFGTLTGTVDTRTHAPVPGECVTAVPFRTATDPASGFPAQQEVAVTSLAGSYTLTALMPGRYKIEFSTGCGASGFATQWWDNAGSARSAKVVTVKFATITGIDATLRR